MKLCIRIEPNIQGGYTARCPSLPGCVCKAPTPEEAQKKIDQAICGYLAAMGDFVPERLVHEVQMTEA